jgi:hypothetical protein
MPKLKKPRKKRAAVRFDHDTITNRFFKDVSKLRSQDDGWIHRSYQSFLGFFDARSSIGASEAILGASLAYAWMPTILDFNGSPEEVALLLQRVKQGESLSNEELNALAKVVNNSMVGASKLLHFVRPDMYAIWDSRVYRYLTLQKPYAQRMRDPASYLEFLKLLQLLVSDKRFASAHRRVEKVVGYSVSPLRAAEYVMFVNGRP